MLSSNRESDQLISSECERERQVLSNQRKGLVSKEESQNQLAEKIESQVLNKF